MRYKIVWRESKTGNIRETAGLLYASHAEADAALATLLRYRIDGLTPTIEAVREERGVKL